MALDPEKVHEYARYLIPDIDRWAKIHGHQLNWVDLQEFDFVTAEIFYSRCTRCDERVFFWRTGYVRLGNLYSGEVSSLFDNRKNNVLCKRLKTFI